MLLKTAEWNWFRKVSNVRACQNFFLTKTNVLDLWQGWGAMGQDLHTAPPCSFQLSCPLPPSPRLYTVSPLDQAEWHSVLGATQLWNHLEALKKTCWDPTPRNSDIIGVLCGLGTRTSMCSPSWYPHSPSFPLAPSLPWQFYFPRSRLPLKANLLFFGRLLKICFLPIGRHTDQRKK